MDALRTILEKADADRAAVGHFNVAGLVTFQAVVAVGRELRAARGLVCEREAGGCWGGGEAACIAAQRCWL